MVGLPRYVFCLGATAAISSVVTLIVARLARRWGLVDLPSARKIHATPIPRIGGLAIALAFFATAVPLLTLFRSTLMYTVYDRSQVTTVLASGLFILFVGLADDVFNLAARYKLVALVAAAAALCSAGVRIHSIQISQAHRLPLELASWPVSMLWVIAVTVSINFIDGLDGLAAGIVAMASGVLFVASAVSGYAEVAFLSLCILGSLLGFLVFNFNPASIFMGDSGSMFVGYMFASCSMLCADHSGTTIGLVVPGIALTVPLFDTCLTLVRRSILQRRSLFSAERGHIHHNLLDQGLTQRQVVFVLYGLTAIASFVALAVLFWGGWAMVGSLSILLVSVGLIFRTAGSTRLRETLSAVRRNRALGREARRYRTAFEDMQIRFRTAHNFDLWWEQLCFAAEKFDFLGLTLPLTNRDGSPRILRWQRTDDQFNDCPTATAVLPIQQRRTGGPLRAEVEVAAATFLESAGQRIALFSRLVGDHSLAQLDAILPPPIVVPPGAPGASVGPDARQGRSGLSSGSASARGNNFAGSARLAPAALAVPRHAAPSKAPSDLVEPRIAVVHDFLYVYAGAEKVLEQILRLYPRADLFALFDFLPENERGFIQHKTVKTSFIQNMPFARRIHRSYLPLMPLAIEQFDFSEYDIVISSSYVAAKGIISRPNQLHVCYCHTPARFAWDLQNNYLAKRGFVRNIHAVIARVLLHYIRQWDTHSANRVDSFVTNSNFVASRIRKTYRRDAVAIYPPVDTSLFTPSGTRADFYLTASRLVPYKRVDLIVEAFGRMPEKRLVVVGDGPEIARLRAMATPNVRLVGHQPIDRLINYMQMAQAFVFAAEEDFGIAPVEAQACGTPVIAYGEGGVTESVIPGRTGVFFPTQTAEAIVGAVLAFEAAGEWDRDDIRRNAERFSVERFRSEFASAIEIAWNANRAELGQNAGEHRPDLSLSIDLPAPANTGEAPAGRSVRLT